MPKRRLIFQDQTAVYHVMNRLVRKEFWLDERCREVLVGLLRRYSEFTGVEVLTYCMMSNHFHLLVRVPPSALWSYRAGQPTVDDDALLARYRRFYGKRRPLGGLSATELEACLKAGDAVARSARERVLARMGDLSVFMRELKYAFAGWFNETYGNEGTIWSTKFKSVVVEDVTEVRARVAAYIDLNPVRAGIVNGPGEYRWCGYTAALGGCTEARTGLLGLFARVSAEGADGALALTAYRQLLNRCAGESEPPAEDDSTARGALRCRQPFISEARAIGRERYIESVLREEIGQTKRRAFRPRDLASAFGSGLFALCRRRFSG